MFPAHVYGRDQTSTLELLYQITAKEKRMTRHSQLLEKRLESLESHLREENDVLADAVSSYRELDKVAHRMGLLPRSASFASRVPWWPMVSILGTFSAGKSTFINSYLGRDLQRTGNQAVDDRFSVICYSNEDQPRTLPGAALNADPRFPFYQISEKLEEVADGQGHRVDAYLQMKTCDSEAVKGKVVIDSPGFDADAQRTSTLKIIDHIVGLSDLVLVFFDARHPEPGAMQDTLEHLVSATINRQDSGKFLYILNQIDSAAREDNAEDVVAAWQRAMGEKGLTAGRFFTVFDQQASTLIEDPEVRARFEKKSQRDLGDIYERIGQVGVERGYRIVSSLDQLTHEIQGKAVPAITSAMKTWRSWVLGLDAALLVFLLIMVVIGDFTDGWWADSGIMPGWLADGWQFGELAWSVVIVGIMVALHFLFRKLVSDMLGKRLNRTYKGYLAGSDIASALKRTTRPWRSLFAARPAGWGARSKRILLKVLGAADTLVQSMNDRYTQPSGSMEKDIEVNQEASQ